MMRVWMTAAVNAHALTSRTIAERIIELMNDAIRDADVTTGNRSSSRSFSHQREILDIAGGAVNRRFDRPDDLEARLARECKDRIEGFFPQYVVAHHAALPDFALPHFELGFHQRDDLRRRRGDRDNRRQHQPQRDETRVDD